MENLISTIYITPQKRLIKIGALFFIFLVSLYLFILGSVVSGISQKKRLNRVLEQQSQAFYLLETEVAKARNDLNLNSFSELGYGEVKKFEVIKTLRNVASAKTPIY